jgi:hypothetical protein
MGGACLVRSRHWFGFGRAPFDSAFYEYRCCHVSVIVILLFQTRLEEIPPEKSIKELRKKWGHIPFFIVEANLVQSKHGAGKHSGKRQSVERECVSAFMRQRVKSKLKAQGSKREEISSNHSFRNLLGD